MLLLSKDRQERNIWTPVGGEIDVPNSFAEQAEIEALEEIGVKAKITRVFQVIELYDEKSFYLKTHNAHMEIVECFGEIIQGTPQCIKQPSEPDCETVEFKWLTYEQFLIEFESGVIRVYPNIAVSIDVLHHNLFLI